MKKTITTIALVTMSGSALAQSGLDIDRAYAAELRADANTRSSLLGSNGSALDISIFTQFRYTYNSRSAVAPGDFADDDITVGFSTPRTQIRLSGGVEGTDITGHLSFDFGGAFDRGSSVARSAVAGTFVAGDGGATLRDAYATWGIDDNWTFLFGQFKNPFSHEANVAPEHSQGVERSILNSFFDVGYTQGIALNYTDDEWKFTVALTDGPAIYTGGTVASNSFYTSAGESDISVTGRLDWLVSGTWDQFADFASWQGSNSGLRIGAGLHWSQKGDTNPTLVTSVFDLGAAGTVDTETVTAWTIDAQYEADGWGLFASFTSVNIDADFTIASALGSADLTNDGFLLQGNIFFTEQFEAFARYDIIFLDDDASLAALAVPLNSATSEDKYSTFTVGFNYYLVPESHAARFSMDLSVALDDSSGMDFYGSDVATTGRIGGTGGTAADDEFMIRGQFSLLF